MGTHNADVFQRQAAEVKSILGADLEIVEAKTDFVVYVTADEQKNSKRGDPNNCMFSNACKRAFGSKGVLFYPTVAYVDMIDPNDSSRRIIMRFRLPADTRYRLEQFDRQDDETFKEATFILKAVPKSQTLAHNLKAARKRRRLLQAGKVSIDSARSAGAKKAHETRKKNLLMGVRSGVGQIHTRQEEVTP